MGTNTLTYELPRGHRDLEPATYGWIERVRSVFMETARHYGFRAMEPAVLELLATLEAKSGPGIREEIYEFRDKAGREVGLRFDLTVGLTRYVVSNRGLQLPAKLAAFGGVFRYDEPQYARYRWFNQWDVEIFDQKDDVGVDAEVIDFTSTLFERLGLGFEIRIGDRRTMDEYMRSKLGIADDAKAADLLRAVDKLSKKKAADVVRDYEARGLRQEDLERLLTFARHSGSPDRVLTAIEAEAPQAHARFRRLVEELAVRGTRHTTFDLSVVRGIDYYDGVVFEVYDTVKPELGQLAGGGRYDVLPAQYGRPDVGATGVAGGVERIVLSLQAKGDATTQLQPRVFVAYATEAFVQPAKQLAATLRREGVSTEIDLHLRPLRRQLELANDLRARYVALLAPKEQATGELVLRDMSTGEERRIKADGILEAIRPTH